MRGCCRKRLLKSQSKSKTTNGFDVHSITITPDDSSLNKPSSVEVSLLLVKQEYFSHMSNNSERTRGKVPNGKGGLIDAARVH